VRISNKSTCLALARQVICIVQVSSAAEVSDIKRARMLMKSMVNTNPKSPHAWIAYARLEEIAGELKTARSIIAQVMPSIQAACSTAFCPWHALQGASCVLKQMILHADGSATVSIENLNRRIAAILTHARQVQHQNIALQGTEACPQNEDVWLEAARLQTPENARSMLARGVQQLPNSIKLWMQAARVEHDDAAKRRVLRKALERNSKSVRLWKAAVELHDEDEARLLLSRAVECCPDQVDLWIALVRLEPDFKRAKQVSMPLCCFLTEFFPPKMNVSCWPGFQ
jgi:pre-mRNA-processing factor 6